MPVASSTPRTAYTPAVARPPRALPITLVIVCCRAAAQLGSARVGGQPGHAADQERPHGERAELGGGPALGDQAGQDPLAPVGVDQREPGQVADPRRAHRRPGAGQLREQQDGEQDGLQHADDHRRRRQPGERGDEVDHVVDQRRRRVHAPVTGPLHPVVEVRSRRRRPAPPGVVRSYSRTSTTWSTCGSSRLCAQPAAVATPERSRRRDRDQDQGRAAPPAPGAGSGPAANSACSTPVVANSAYPPNTPDARFSAIVATVSRLFADQPRLTACPISAGNRRATSREPDRGHPLVVGPPVVGGQLGRLVVGRLAAGRRRRRASSAGFSPAGFSSARFSAPRRPRFTSPPPARAPARARRMTQSRRGRPRHHPVAMP